MPELRAKITADGSQFYSNFNQVGNYLEGQSKKMAKKFESAFGVGVLGGFAISKLQSMFTAPLDRAGDIAEGAKRLQVTAEEYQMVQLAADEAGMSVDTWIASVKDGHTPMEVAIRDLERFREEVRFTSDDIDVLTGKGTEGFAKDMDSVWTGVSRWLTDKFATFFAGREIGTPEAMKGLEEYNRQAKSQSKTPSSNWSNLFQGSPVEQAVARASASLLAPYLTARQQIGAYSGADAFITTIERQTRSVERIEQKVNSVDETVRQVLAQ